MNTRVRLTHQQLRLCAFALTFIFGVVGILEATVKAAVITQVGKLEVAAEEPDLGAAETHLWLAEQIQINTLDNQSAETRHARVQEQIDLALSAGPLKPMAHLTLGTIYERRAKRVGDKSDEYRKCLTSAIKHLQASTAKEITSLGQVIAMPRVLEYHQVLGNTNETVLVNANEMIKKAQPFVNENPNQILGWYALVECATKTKQYKRAHEIIRNGFVTSTSNEVRKQLASLASSILVQEADDYSDMSDDVAFRTRLVRLSRAINTNPKNIEIYPRLLEYVTEEPNGFFQPGRLEDSLSELKKTAVAHSVIGFSAAMHGNVTKAQSHWKIAEQQYTLLPVVLDELLKAAIRSDANELADLIPLFEIAIDSLQFDALLRQTRGLYFRTKNRDVEAVADLEAAVKALPKLVEARKLLIILYTESGDMIKAEGHRQKLDAVLTEMPANQQKIVQKRLELIK